jgi:hypothetical protein
MNMSSEPQLISFVSSKKLNQALWIYANKKKDKHVQKAKYRKGINFDRAKNQSAQIIYLQTTILANSYDLSYAAKRTSSLAKNNMCRPQRHDK